MQKNKLLLIQFRDDVSIEHDYQCFCDKLPIKSEQIKVFNAVTEDSLPNIDSLMNDVFMVILGGSGQFDISKAPKPLMGAIKRISPLLDYIFKNDTPTLGICMGHQIIALHNNGIIEATESYAETGYIDVNLTDDGKKDTIIGKFPTLKVIMGHKDTVTSIPKNASVLAHTKTSVNTILKYKNNIYSVQFHPEMNGEDLIKRTTLYPQYLKNTSLKKLRDEMQDVSSSNDLLTDMVSCFYKRAC